MNNETSRTHMSAEDLKGAWADYEKATDAAWDEYEKARAPVWAEYQKARPTALVAALTHDSVETAP